jgi:hypothetical protein
MSFQEWMDRHPSLQGRGGPQNFDAYHGATQQNNMKTGGPVQVGAPKQFATGPGTGQLVPTPGGDPGFDDSRGVATPLPVLPGPDKPPMSATRGASLGAATSTKPDGTSYKEFLGKRGVNARKSSRANAAGWRRMNQKKKPGNNDTGQNNTQGQH